MLAARFAEKADIGRRVFVGKKSQRIGGSLSRESRYYLGTCVGGSKITAVRRRLALLRRL